VSLAQQQKKQKTGRADAACVFHKEDLLAKGFSNPAVMAWNSRNHPTQIIN
jgi:hypothetical protein